MNLAVGIALLLALFVPASALAAEDPTTLVNPFVGTAAGAADFGTGGGAGNTFPGATVPFGMVQFSPDTLPGLEAFGGGYSHDDETLNGFSLRHLSGPGCSVYQDVPILPTSKPVDRSPAKRNSIEYDAHFTPTFSHATERAAPGAYSVRAGDVDVDLTAAARTAVGRFRFERAGGSVLLNAAGTAMGADTASVRIDPARREVTGSVTTGRFCFQRNAYTLHFAARFSEPFTAHGTWKRQLLQPGATAGDDTQPGAIVKKPAPGTPNDGNNSGPTAQTGAYVTFGDRLVEVKIGVSFVDVDGARANLESGGFEATREAAHDAWRRELGRIRVRGGRREDRRVFTTALYHSLLHPSTFSDADGRYRGMDGAIHRAGGFTKYADYSGWDTYRTQAPLLAMLDPKRASDMVRSLQLDAAQSGYLPKWSVANGHTNVMVGDPALPIIASTHAFGGRAFDGRAALDAMVRNASVPGRSANGGYVPRAGLEEYQRLGYVPYERNADVTRANFAPDLAWGSTATTLEYAVADHALARLAAALGQRETCATFAQRAAAWRNVLDPATRTMARRSASGAFLPTEPAGEDGFVEGNAEQYTWFVPHDVAGLIEALGGRDAARDRLDTFFKEINAGPHAPHAFLGNEPTLHAPWLYAWLGRPDRTQALVRRALLELYGDTPEGFPGNDDLGAMSAWWVLGALGLYPAVPGTDVMVLGSPLFPRATIKGALDVRARHAGRDRRYVSALRLGRDEHAQPWTTWRDLRRAGSMTYRMQSAPSDWGRDAPAPPSYAGAPSC